MCVCVGMGIDVGGMCHTVMDMLDDFAFDECESSTSHNMSETEERKKRT